MTDQRTFSIAFLEETVISLMFYVLLQWFIMISFQRILWDDASRTKCEECLKKHNFLF